MAAMQRAQGFADQFAQNADAERFRAFGAMGLGDPGSAMNHWNQMQAWDQRSHDQQNIANGYMTWWRR